MARKNVNAGIPTGALLLKCTSKIKETSAFNDRVCNIMDSIRGGGANDMVALGAALGVSAAEAGIIFSQFTSIRTTMNGVDFVNLADVDQG